MSGIYTYHYDNLRTGLNAAETILTPANVNSATFEKIFSDPVDGQMYAEPLYVTNVTIPGAGTHNVVYAATENDNVYAFDADFAGAPLWQTSLLPAGATPIPATDTSCTQIVPIIGITPTPVIDPATGTSYVLAQSKEHGGYVARLHAIDITTGTERLHSPVVITGSFQGSGGTVNFDPLRNSERAALLLEGNTVYIAASSHCDVGQYNRWIFGYDKTSLAQTAVFNTTPNGSQGAIWMSGGGPASDQTGRIYFSTGDGTFDANTGGPDYGDSFLALNPATLAVDDYFTPFNQASLVLSMRTSDRAGSCSCRISPDRTRISRSAPARAPRSTWSIATTWGSSTRRAIRSSMRSTARSGCCSARPPTSTGAST